MPPPRPRRNRSGSDNGHRAADDRLRLHHQPGSALPPSHRSHGSCGRCGACASRCGLGRGGSHRHHLRHPRQGCCRAGVVPAMLPGAVIAVAAAEAITGGRCRTPAGAGAPAVRRRRSGKCGVSKREPGFEGDCPCFGITERSKAQCRARGPLVLMRADCEAASLTTPPHKSGWRQQPPPTCGAIRSTGVPCHQGVVAARSDRIVGGGRPSDHGG
jgi:hypothetical protein